MTTSTRSRPRNRTRIRPRRTPLDDVEGVARIVATAYLEIRDGHRDLRCLRRHVTATVAHHLGEVARAGGHRGSRPVSIVDTRWTAQDGRVDACVLVRQTGRVTVVALRMEVRDGRWLVTELSAPEDLMRLRGTS